jgi:predicted alpha/beta-hydrolase family hydrolase
MSPRRKRPTKALLLTPGAGADRDHHTLVAVEEAVAPMPVARVDFPYRKEGRKAPDRAPKLIACIVEEAGTLARSTGVAADQLILGGRSMGGRMCSMAVAEGLPAGGLVLLSYPLHPPGKPERLRTEHLPALDLPCLFVGGTRDTFGTPEEMEAATALIPGPVTHVWLEGQGHDPKRSDDVIAAAVAEWVADLP